MMDAENTYCTHWAYLYQLLMNHQSSSSGSPAIQYESYIMYHVASRSKQYSSNSIIPILYSQYHSKQNVRREGLIGQPDWDSIWILYQTFGHFVSDKIEMDQIQNEFLNKRIILSLKTYLFHMSKGLFYLNIVFSGW